MVGSQPLGLEHYCSPQQTSLQVLKIVNQSQKECTWSGGGGGPPEEGGGGWFLSLGGEEIKKKKKKQKKMAGGGGGGGTPTGKGWGCSLSHLGV